MLINLMIVIVGTFSTLCFLATMCKIEGDEQEGEQ